MKSVCREREGVCFEIEEVCREIESACKGCGRERVCLERERSRFVKIKNIKKRNLLYGCFKKQSTQKISNQKMKSKERDKSILEYVQCMYNNVHAFKVPGF